VSIKTLGDLIQVKRHEKNLTTGHLALKMGIATALVRSWENGTSQPDSQQSKTLADILGFDAGNTIAVADGLNKVALCAHIAGTVAAMTESDPSVASEKASYNLLG